MLRKLRLRPKPREDGPVFISYRRSDGASYVDLIETFLWAGGIAPWRDIIDLPAGETDMRIREAFRQGISAAILVVTPEIGDSEFVPRVELPALLALDRGSDNSALGSQVPQAENQFRLYIVNTIPKPGKSANASLEVDHTAPDRLLRTGRRFRLHGLRSGSSMPLARRQQYPLLPGDAAPVLQHLLRDLVRQRLAVRRYRLADRQIDINVQTRPTPDAYTRPHGDGSGDHQVDLVIRLGLDEEDGLPRELGYRCLQYALPIVIDELHNREVTRITFSGGGHQSVLWALGAAIPETRHPLGSVEFVDHRHAGPSPQPSEETQQPMREFVSPGAPANQTERLVWREHTMHDGLLPGDLRTHSLSFVDLAGRATSADEFMQQLKVSKDAWRDQHRGVPPAVVVLMSAKAPDMSLVTDLKERLPNCIGAITLQVLQVRGALVSHFPLVMPRRRSCDWSTAHLRVFRCWTIKATC